MREARHEDPPTTPAASPTTSVDSPAVHRLLDISDADRVTSSHFSPKLFDDSVLAVSMQDLSVDAASQKREDEGEEGGGEENSSIAQMKKKKKSIKRNKKKKKYKKETTKKKKKKKVQSSKSQKANKAKKAKTTKALEMSKKPTSQPTQPPTTSPILMTPTSFPTFLDDELILISATSHLVLEVDPIRVIEPNVNALAETTLRFLEQNIGTCG